MWPVLCLHQILPVACATPPAGHSTVCDKQACFTALESATLEREEKVDAMQAPPSLASTSAASTSQALAPGAAGEEDGWAAFMDAANPPAPASSTLQPAAEDHWDAFQVEALFLTALNSSSSWF